MPTENDSFTKTRQRVKAYAILKCLCCLWLLWIMIWYDYDKVYNVNIASFTYGGFASILDWVNYLVVLYICG